MLGVRAPVSTAQRYVVLLRPPSLAARVRAAGGRVVRERRCARGRRPPSRSRSSSSRGSRPSGARIAPEYRYTRVVNGFSARLDPTSAALLDDDREVTGIYPVRIAYPAQAAESSGGVLPSAVADLEIAGPRRVGRDGGAARHRRRPVASVPAAPRALGRRRDQPGQRRDRPAASRRSRDGPSVTRPSSRGSSPAPRGRTACTGSRPARRSCPSASAAGSRTRRVATASTRAPTRSSPGSRRPSIRTTTATSSTRHASRSSGWSSRTPRSRTDRSRARSPAPPTSTC